MSKIQEDGLENVENDLTWENTQESNYSGIHEDTRPYFSDNEVEEPKPSVEEEEEPEELLQLFEEAGARAGESLFRPGESEELLARWFKIEARFSDDPLRTVKDSHALLLEVIQRLLLDFNNNPALLDGENQEEISREDLRLTLKRYEAFFDRLLASKAW